MNKRMSGISGSAGMHHKKGEFMLQSIKIQTI